MRKIIKNIRLAAFFALLLAVHFVYAEKTSIENLHQYKMENGLTVFIAENHTVPLVYIEIAIRAGAVTQTPQTAGLFHLYEHMMFKGNSLYKDAASVNRALSNLGVASWNGTTGINHVNYFFTVPSAKLEEGLAFWNAAIRSPLIDEHELQNEKKVVLSEIEGGKSDPSKIFYSYLSKNLFPDAPYKVDSSGSFEAVRNATSGQLREIKEKYYIPSNAALFIGGDIIPDQAFELAEKIFGTWSNNGNSMPENSVQQNTQPFSAPQYCVMPFDKLTPELMQIMVQFRGPDADFDIQDTYAVDYLMSLMSEPGSDYIQGLYKNKSLKISDFNNSWAQYATVRANGLLEFGTIASDAETMPAERARIFLDEIQNSIIPKIVSEKKFFTDSYKSKIIEQMKDSYTRSTETPSGLLASIRSWWINTDTDYFFSYYENLAKVSQDDVKRVAEKYFTKKNPLVSVLLNPAVYEKTRAEFLDSSFYEIQPDEKSWWQEEKFQCESKPVEFKKTKISEENIYVPGKSQEKNSSSISAMRNIEVKKLKNGIPVFINQTSDRIISAAILCPGGVEKLTPETSGLETALFSFMSETSKKFSYEKRTKLAYSTNSSIGYFSKLSGSALYLSAMDKHFEKMLPVFLDGFLNPEFKKNEYENTISNLNQKIQSMLNNPTSLLSYTILEQTYKGHPYEATTFATPRSIKNITVENLKQHHANLIKSGNFSIVVSGKVDSDYLIKTLNSSLGKLEFSGAEQTRADIPPLSIRENPPVILRHPSAEGTAYITRIFASPPNSSRDFIPCILAGNIYTDILFNVVREHYGICYSPQSYVIGSKAPYGSEYLFKVSDFAGFEKALQEARTYMAEGRIVEKISGSGDYEFSTISQNLDSYKNSYINQTYQSQQTSAGLVSILSYNLLQFGDIDYDLKQLEQLRETTAQEILNVFRKYWIEAPSSWFAVTGLESELYFSSQEKPGL
ncbi:M16 family metallopeptidase [Treponema sp.]|uniref:M16 family metallopeptidase n=1 Tax=Treponema sp. TaxID=166 RepID=UPI003EFEFFE3